MDIYLANPNCLMFSPENLECVMHLCIRLLKSVRQRHFLSENSWKCRGSTLFNIIIILGFNILYEKGAHLRNTAHTSTQLQLDFSSSLVYGYYGQGCCLGRAVFCKTRECGLYSAIVGTSLSQGQPEVKFLRNVPCLPKLVRRTAVPK